MLFICGASWASHQNLCRPIKVCRSYKWKVLNVRGTPALKRHQPILADYHQLALYVASVWVPPRGGKTADKKKKEATNPTWKSSVKAVPRTVFLMVGKDDVF
jgi:hypothetical protein